MVTKNRIQTSKAIFASIFYIFCMIENIFLQVKTPNTLHVKIRRTHYNDDQNDFFWVWYAQIRNPKSEILA